MIVTTNNTLLIRYSVVIINVLKFTIENNTPKELQAKFSNQNIIPGGIPVKL